MDFRPLVSLSARVMEVAGVCAMVLGAGVALVVLLFRRQGLRAGEAYRHFRLNLGRAILLGLEFLVAADIIRTVSDEPSLTGVLVLGLIVLIRTFLSFTLTVELEGRWPWQPDKDEAHDASTPPPRVPPSPRVRPAIPDTRQPSGH